jgi:hypothetical protein
MTGPEVYRDHTVSDLLKEFDHAPWSSGSSFGSA